MVTREQRFLANLRTVEQAGDRYRLLEHDWTAWNNAAGNGFANPTSVVHLSATCRRLNELAIVRAHSGAHLTELLALCAGSMSDSVRLCGCFAFHLERNGLDNIARIAATVYDPGPKDHDGVIYDREFEDAAISLWDDIRWTLSNPSWPGAGPAVDQLRSQFVANLLSRPKVPDGRRRFIVFRDAGLTGRHARMLRSTATNVIVDGPRFLALCETTGDRRELDGLGDNVAFLTRSSPNPDDDNLRTALRLWQPFDDGPLSHVTNAVAAADLTSFTANT